MVVRFHIRSNHNNLYVLLRWADGSVDARRARSWSLLPLMRIIGFGPAMVVCFRIRCWKDLSRSAASQGGRSARQVRIARLGPEENGFDIEWRPCVEQTFCIRLSLRLERPKAALDGCFDYYIRNNAPRVEETLQRLVWAQREIACASSPVFKWPPTLVKAMLEALYSKGWTRSRETQAGGYERR